MKPKLLGLAAGAALLALPATQAAAQMGASLEVDFVLPAPVVVVERYPAYVHHDPYPARVVYVYRDGHRHYVRHPHRHVRYYHGHDRGRHRGHHHRRWKD